MKSVELKAIGWYAVENSLKVQISPYPTIYFKRGNDDVKIGINAIVAQYQRHKEEDRKLKAKERRLRIKEEK